MPYINLEECRRIIRYAEFDEAKHPRDEEGKFAGNETSGRDNVSMTPKQAAKELASIGDANVPYMVSVARGLMEADVRIPGLALAIEKAESGQVSSLQEVFVVLSKMKASQRIHLANKIRSVNASVVQNFSHEPFPIFELSDAAKALKKKKEQQGQ